MKLQSKYDIYFIFLKSEQGQRLEAETSMLFGSTGTLFQNHKDIVYITGFDHVNDDNFTVFTPQQLGIFILMTILYSKALEDRKCISNVLQPMHCTDGYFLVN